MSEEQIDKSARGSLERIADSLEMIALFLQVLAEDQTPVDEATTANTVMTQDGLIELRQPLTPNHN